MERGICRIGIAALACILVIGPATEAKTIRVGSSAAAGYRSLKPAVHAALRGDVIIVEQGLYTGDDNRDIVISSKAITIRSEDPNDPVIVAATVIDCQGTEIEGHRAFDVYEGNDTLLVLEGLTISNDSGPVSGGAVLCEKAVLRAFHCTFSNNRVAWHGSAVYCYESQAWFEGCRFSNNACESANGGTIFCSASTVDLENCTFESNRGGTVMSLDSRLRIHRSIFEENKAGNGGAVYCSTASSPESASGLDVSRCTFTANTAAVSGGAVYNSAVGAQIHGCTFIANTAAQDGGAILNDRGNLLLSDCVLVSNTAVGLGGGVLSLSRGAPQILNCTFVANDAGQGGAIAGRGDARSLVSHSILWRNTAGRGSQLYLARDYGGYYNAPDATGATATVEYCDIEGGRGGAYEELECTLIWSAGNINAEPLFTGPAYDDYRLSPDSACIDAGDPCYVPLSGSTDLDDYPRRFGSTVDLGAYEFRGLGPVYRFWSPLKGKHFYTLHGAERDRLVSEFPHAWTYQDVAYYAFYQPVVENLLPVYRFWSPSLDAHFWTLDEQECLRILEEHSTIWIFEGIVFYAFQQGRQPLDAVAVYRFWSADLAHHLYTMDEAEKKALIENYSDLWEYEGVAWYTYLRPQDLGMAAYAFTGGSSGAWYKCALAASIDGQEARINSADVQLPPASTQMQMTIDFRRLIVSLDTLSVRTNGVEHTAEVTLPGTELKIPLVLSIQASFVLPTMRGPYTVDPTTRLFADFRETSQDIAGKDSFFTYSGSVSLADRQTSFDRTMPTTRFELESVGGFEALSLLPDGLYANMPLTFQWHRQQTRDLLAEDVVNGRRVQIYVTYSYVGTQGLWQGKLIE